MRILVLLLVASVALPTSAQFVPDEFPDATESMAERNRRDLVERHRGFLSGLYSESAFAVGPQAGAPDLLAGATAENGYRFASGDALALVTAYRAPLALDPVSRLPEAGSVLLGANGTLALRRFAPSSGLARRAELGIGVSALFDEAATIPTLDITPRVTIPLTPVMSLPVGVRISHELGDATPRGTFVGLSIGVRRIWADEARMVLE